MDCQDWCMTYRTVGQLAQIIIQQVDNTKPEYESHPAPVLYGIYIPPAMRSSDKIMGDFWVIVIDVLQEPCAFVMRSQEVKDDAHRGEKDGRISYWLQPKAYDKEDFREKWDRIVQGEVLLTTP